MSLEVEEENASQASMLEKLIPAFLAAKSWPQGQHHV